MVSSSSSSSSLFFCFFSFLLKFFVQHSVLNSWRFIQIYYYHLHLRDCVQFHLHLTDCVLFHFHLTDCVLFHFHLTDCVLYHLHLTDYVVFLTDPQRCLFVEKASLLCFPPSRPNVLSKLSDSKHPCFQRAV